MTKKRWIATVVAICMVVLLFQYIPVLHASAATEGSIKSGVTGVYFRETPGGTPIKDSNGNTIYLNGGQALTIQDTSNSSWYKVTLTYNGGSYTGYVSSQYVVQHRRLRHRVGMLILRQSFRRRGSRTAISLICALSMRNTQTGNFGRFRPEWIGIHL